MTLMFQDRNYAVTGRGEDRREMRGRWRRSARQWEENDDDSG